MRQIALLALAAILSSSTALCAVRPGSEAQYYLASSSENQKSPVHRVRIFAGDVEKVRGRAFQWWEMTLVKPAGEVLGVKVLSVRVPLTSTEGIGEVARYIYAPAGEKCTEYIDDQTGAALLPELETFRQDFLPCAAAESRYTDGFANTGSLIGHVLVRSNVRSSFPRASFDGPRVLRLRGDLRIGAQVDARDDRDESVPIDKRDHTRLTRAEYMEMIAAGANHFGPDAEAMEWIKDLPVFYRGQGTHPDDFYRSNFLPGRWYLDEPATRFGWEEGVPGGIVGPDVIAQAITMRVQEAVLPHDRRFTAHDAYHSGAMDALYNKPTSWETQQYTAWYQMAGGATALIFEGRYVKRGYGWAPESLLGKGMDDLTDKQQYDYFHAFLRGAARYWGRYWGTSVYPEGDRSMMVPALCRAYDQGARCLWFWADRNLPYKWRIEVLKGLSEHIRNNPRPAPEKTLRSAEAAVVLPSGYMLAEDTIWGMDREQTNQFGVSYGDIAAAALFEGIMLSRAEVEYDYIHDAPGIDKLGYKQLVYVREDGRVERVPRPRAATAPEGLKLSVEPRKGEGIASRVCERADFTVERVSGITVDGDLSDWDGAKWISLDGDPHIFGDNYKTELTLKVPQDLPQKPDMKFLGFTWDQISEDYRVKYLLEGWQDNQVVVTSVEPGSAADQAGLREGDVILYMNEKWTRWAFEVWGIVDRLKKQPGASVHLKILRNGVDNLGGSSDLSARVAFRADDSYLYFAADVIDDVHYQAMRGPDYWQNDSVQIGIDPTLARTHGYGEHGHEIGFALDGGRPVAWRWAGRRGQPVNVLKDVKTAIVRAGDRTVYEAAIPFSELAPLSPDMWPRVGMSVTVNDSDGTDTRKSRLELVRGVMTRGKRLHSFPSFTFEPSPDSSKVSAAITWERRCMKPGGSAELAVAVSSPRTRSASVTCRLVSLDSPEARPAVARIEVPMGPESREFVLKASTLSQPGRYRMYVEVAAPDGSVAASDSLPVYVYK